MAREETPTAEFLAAHASSAVHRISVSFKQADSVTQAVGQQNDQFSCKRQVKPYWQNPTDRIVVFNVFKSTIGCILLPLASVTKGVIWREREQKY